MKKLFTLFAAMMAMVAINAVEVVDTLNQSVIGIKGTSYTNFADKTVASTAVYAGQCAANYGSIQLRATNPSGVITTTSGGNVKKITVTWNTNTADGRTLSVYGSNTAYTDPAKLYGSKEEQGTPLGEIVKGTSTELTVTGDYAFVAFRSKSGAMYLDNAVITWDAIAPAVVAPKITATETNFLEKTTITIESAEETTVYYTTDGTTPDNTKTAYNAPFDVTETTTIKAIAYKDADASSVASLTVTKANKLTVSEAIANIKASKLEACYVYGRVVSIQSNTIEKYHNINAWLVDLENETDTIEGYILNGKNNAAYNNASEIEYIVGDTVLFYGEALQLFTNKTTNATTYEFTPGYYVETLGKAERPAVEKPYIAVSEKNFKDSAIVKITCATEGAKIYYTTDESDPTTASKEYTDSIIVKETTTIKAIAVLNEDTSEVATYTVNKIEILTIAEVNEKAVNDNVAFYATVVEVATTGAMLGDETGYIYYFNQSHKLQKGEKVFVTGALSLSTQGGYKGPKQVTNTAKIDSLDMTTVTDPTPVKMDGPALKTWANAPEVKYIKIQGKLVKSGSYINIELEGVEKFDGSLLTPKFDVSALVDQDVIVTGYAFCATGTSTVHANIMATSVVARAASKTEVNFNTAEVTVTADPFITFELGGDATLSIPDWAGGNAFANKYIGGTYDIDLVSENIFELTVGGKEVELTEGTLTVTYIDCKKDYSQNLYEYKLNAYTAESVLYYSCDTIWTNVKPDNTYVAEDNINVNATTATSIASEMKADEVTNRAYNIFGYVVKIDEKKNYYLNDDKNATTGFEAYNPTVSGTVAIGDYVRVNAKMTNYQGKTPETNGTAKLQAWDINNLPVLRATPTVDTIPATVAKAVEIGATLAENATSKEVYEVTGFVVVAYDADEKGEQTWYMCDTMITDTTNFDSFKKELLMVQFTKADRNVVAGDNMTVFGKILNYKKSDGTKEYIVIRNAAATHNNATAIRNNEATEQKAAKFIENGRIVIRRGEKKYTIVGQAY